MKKLNQAGFSALVVLVVIVIVAAISGTGALVYKNLKHTTTSAASPTADKSLASAPTKSNQVDAQEQYLVVADWGVKMTIPAAFKLSANSQLSWSYGQTKDEILFTSDLQKSVPASCQSSSDTAGPWGVDRYTETTVDQEAKAYMKHIGSYYYQRVYPQVGCKDNGPVDTAYKQLFDSLQAE